MKRLELIPKHKSGRQILKALEVFGNAQISGDSGAGAAAAAASGYKYDRDKHRFVQSEKQIKEAEELRNNLAIISTFSPTHPITATIENGFISVISKALRGKKYTQNLIRALGDKKTTKGFDPLKGRSDKTSKLAAYLKKCGVDVSKFSESDLHELIRMRQQSVIESLPTNTRAVVADQRYINSYNLYENGRNVGKMRTYSNINGTQSIGDVQKLNPSTKLVSRNLNDAALKTGAQEGTSGLLSGDHLLSPEQTKHIWAKYYPHRTTVRSTGIHEYNSGTYVTKTGAPIKVRGDVVDLVTPYEDIPVKSSNIFHPSMIDDVTKTLKKPDWSNPNIYKTLVPITMGTTTISQTKDY
jgi:hypothetical protein